MARGFEEVVPDLTTQILQHALGPAGVCDPTDADRPAEYDSASLVAFVSTAPLCINSREQLVLCVRAFAKCRLAAAAIVANDLLIRRLTTHAYDFIVSRVDAQSQPAFFRVLFDACRANDSLHALIRLPWTRAERNDLKTYLVEQRYHVRPKELSHFVTKPQTLVTLLSLENNAFIGALQQGPHSAVRVWYRSE